jgi:hypothetical protein
MRNYRGKGNRCPATRVEDLRTWHCQLRAGHAGEHVNYQGHRYWGGELTDKLAKITADLWRTERALLSEDGANDDRPTARSERR